MKLILDRALGRRGYTHHATDEEGRRAGKEEVKVNGRPVSEGTRVDIWGNEGWGVDKEEIEIKSLKHFHSNTISIRLYYINYFFAGIKDLRAFKEISLFLVNAFQRLIKKIKVFDLLKIY